MKPSHRKNSHLHQSKAPFEVIRLAVILPVRFRHFPSPTPRWQKSVPQLSGNAAKDRPEPKPGIK
jgi:hypothetical protein